MKKKRSLKSFFSFSIRHRLFIQSALMICFFAALIMVINMLFLEKYYTASERRLLAEQTEYINSLNISDYRHSALDLERMEKLNNSMIVIYRPVGNKYFVLYHTNMDFSKGIRDINDISYAVNSQVLHHEQNEDGSVYELQKDHRMSVEYMVYKKQMNNGDILDIRVIRNSMNKSAAMTNQFLLYITAFTLLALVAWAYWASRRFTRPIEEMSEITSAMSRLDFSRQCQVSSTDELSDLAANINHLSLSLGNALEDLQAKNEQLRLEISRKQKLEQARKEFFSNASHELKTPLSIIMGYAEGLQLETLDEEKRQVYVDVIRQEAQKMNKLVHSLLQLSRVESQQAPPAMEELSLKEFTGSILDKYAPIFEDEQITLIRDFPEDAVVLGDRMQLEQVLTNYLNNAVFHVDEPRTIRVSGRIINGRYRVSVYNTGHPIHEEELSDIWFSFYRSDKARNRSNERYGLGLSIVRAIVEMHNGLYGVHNIEDGVEFWFELNIH